MRNFIKKLRCKVFNKLNNTRITSIKANLDATYGVNVGIGPNTVITKDVVIGDYSYVNSNSYIENCSIGKFCSISSGVYISPTEHDYTYKSTHPFLNNNIYGFINENPKVNRKRVVIGNDVLISLNVIITEGVKIGNGAVVAAGAVVTKDVKPYEIVGGVPARHIKYRFDLDMINKLQSEKFWDWDKNKIIRNIDFLKNETELIK
ncbi:CatB-related O-acetyltransferase [Streptococcus suis]